MKKIATLYILFISITSHGQDNLSRENLKNINEFINCFKFNDIGKLCSKVAFPLEREYPLTPIKNCSEFLTRYNEVFDDNIIFKISTSNIKRDWSAVGWRGMMFLNGDIWLDYDGKLIAVNYQSNYEKQELRRKISQEKKILNKQIQSYYKPLHIIETSKFKIRIDDLGNSTYRYSSWSKNASMISKPNLVLTDGIIIFDGSGGNHKYIFKNNEYTYEIFIVIIGELNSPPAVLTVYRNEQEILMQNGKMIKN
jgi:hypothetical protein